MSLAIFMVHFIPFHRDFCGWLFGLYALGFHVLGSRSLDCAVAQEPVPLVHRWVVEPDLDCWHIIRERNEIFIDLARLKSPVDEYRLSEARNIAQSNNQIDPSSKPAAIEAILATLRSAGNSRPIRQAMVSALLKLTDGSELQELWQIAGNDEALREFVEAALIERQHSAAKNEWLVRLADRSSTESNLQLAVRGVAAIGATEALDSLVAIVQSDAFGLPLKIEASRSLGLLSTKGLESLAGELLDSQRFAKEQLAALLLVNHTDAAARELMRKILRQPFAPAQLIAYRWFADHDLVLARELAESMLQHPDNEVRLQAVNVLHRYDDAESLTLQAQKLSDRNHRLRQIVRDHLIEKATNDSLLDAINTALTQHLSGDTYEGAEQAINVVVALQMHERCPQLVRLLEHLRPEVAIRASWALQQLANDPDVLAGVLAHCQRWTERLVNPDPTLPVEDTDTIRLAFAFEALGHNAYQPADEMLRLYVPKNSQRMRPNTRVAAIWALGEIWKGRLDSGLEQPLAERMLDPSIIDAELESVKYVAAITLGKIGNPESMSQFLSATDSPTTPIGQAIQWAMKELNEN